VLRISGIALAAAGAHAEEGYPLEICGFLVGSAKEGVREVQEAWPVRNAWEDDPEQRARMFAPGGSGDAAMAERWEAAASERRYLVAPRELLACMKRAREAGMDLVGIYHTHPNHPAVPSDFDRDAAWPEWSYLILSVRQGKTAECRSWVLEEEGRQFFEEEIVEVEG
jgi:proteasome lid subunit RPN8/RPN11